VRSTQLTTKLTLLIGFGGWKGYTHTPLLQLNEAQKTVFCRGGVPVPALQVSDVYSIDLQSDAIKQFVAGIFFK